MQATTWEDLIVKKILYSSNRAISTITRQNSEVECKHSCAAQAARVMLAGIGFRLPPFYAQLATVTGYRLSRSIARRPAR